MGLDSFVFCDCFEKGRITNAPKGVVLKVEPDGSLGHKGGLGSLESDLAWDNWRENLACEHSCGKLLHHRLGNVTLIGMFRTELNREPARFPILLGKVLYSGSHGGDFIETNIVPALRAEVETLAGFKCHKRTTQGFLDYFRQQMLELIAASESVNKPIAF